MAAMLSLLCPSCPTGHLAKSSGGMSCTACAAAFPFVDGYLDLFPAEGASVTPIQRIMQFPPAVAIYDAFWRPLGYFIGSQRNFNRDADAIAASVRTPTGADKNAILDLACGPGTLTRRIARRAPDATVVGFDLSREMLERAVRLTKEEGLNNVLYVRGNALALPFPAETFSTVTCCGALQLFRDQEQAVSEIARVLAVNGDFLCQTTLGPKRPPFYVRVADRMLKFGYIQLDVLKERLARFNLALHSEERTRINYIFRAIKAE
jgi:ubiquinone/menaquinone biosynthesis C-methylase UbiE